MSGGFSVGFSVGSSLHFERGILLLEDCEGTYLWFGDGTGGDYVAEFSSSAAFYGTKGLRLATKTTTPTDGDVVSATRKIPTPFSDLVVIRMRVKTVSVDILKRYYVVLNFYDGERQYKLGIRVSNPTPKLEYLGSGGSWVEVSGYGQSGTIYSWHLLEFRVDLGLKEYLSVLYQGIETDIRGFAYQDVGADARRYLEIEVSGECSGSFVAQVFFDALYVGEFDQL